MKANVPPAASTRAGCDASPMCPSDRRRSISPGAHTDAIVRYVELTHAVGNRQRNGYPIGLRVPDDVGQQFTNHTENHGVHGISIGIVNVGANRDAPTGVW